MGYRGFLSREVARDFACGCRDSLTFKTACMTGPMDRKDSGLFICDACPYRAEALAETEAQRERDKGTIWEHFESPFGGRLREGDD